MVTEQVRMTKEEEAGEGDGKLLTITSLKKIAKAINKPLAYFLGIVL